MKKRAFTLIELLVVIVIIIMLIGMSVPAYKKAKSKNQKNNSDSASVSKRVTEGADNEFNLEALVNQIDAANQRVVDFSNTLSAAQINFLKQKLEQHERETSNQGAIVLIKSLGGYPVRDAALKIAEKGFNRKGLGQAGKDNGFLIFMSMESHDYDIEVGYGLEGMLTDRRAGEIFRREAVPYFKEGKFYEGLDKALGSIILAIRGEYRGDGTASGESYTSRRSSSSGGYDDAKKIIAGVLLLVLFIISVLLCFAHRIAGGLGGGIGTFFIGWWVFSWPLGLLGGVIGFIIGAISKDIAEAIEESGSGGGSYSTGGGYGGDHYGGHYNGGGFGGGGGGFGGGGASGKW